MTPQQRRAATLAGLAAGVWYWLHHQPAPATTTTTTTAPGLPNGGIWPAVAPGTPPVVAPPPAPPAAATPATAAPFPWPCGGGGT